MKKGSLATVFLVVLVDLIGFGLVLPLLPFYAREFSASPVVIGLLYSVYSIAQLVFSPIWGSWSDRVGRRAIMLLSTSGAVAAYVMFGFAESLTVLFLSRLLAGVMGGNIATAQAYIADVTAPEDRARGMGLIGAAFGIGFVLGPALATALIHPGFVETVHHMGWHSLGQWMEIRRFGLPGFFAAFLSACSFLLVWFFLPETVDASTAKRSGNLSESVRPSVFMPSFWRQLFDKYGATSKDMRSGQDARNQPLLWLLAAIFLLSFGQSSLYSAFPLFAEAELAMEPEEVGIQFFYIGLVAVVVQGGLIRPLSRFFSETALFLTGNILMTLGLGAIALSQSVPMLTLFLGVMALGHSLNLPTVSSLVSQEAGDKNYGAMMGLSQGLSGLGRAAGPTWGGFLFGISMVLPFYVTALIMSLTIWIGWKLYRLRSR